MVYGSDTTMMLKAASLPRQLMPFYTSSFLSRIFDFTIWQFIITSYICTRKMKQKKGTTTVPFFFYYDSGYKLHTSNRKFGGPVTARNRRHFSCLGKSKTYK